MKFRHPLLVLFLLMLSACGGGSGDGGSPGGGTNGPQSTVQINVSNAATVASTSMSEDSVTSNTAGVSLFSTAQTNSNTLKLTEFTRQVLRLDQRGTVQPQLFESFCESGSVSEPSPGSTSGTITFTDCVAGGVTINGSLDYSISGDQNNFTATASYSAFTFSDGTDVVTIDASLTITYSDNGTTETATVSIPEFLVTMGGEYVRLFNYTETEITDSAWNTTTSVDYMFDSSLIGGVVRVTTNPAEGGQPIQQDFADPFPHTGSVVVIGLNSRVRVSANGDGSYTGTVIIEVDANGDAVYEDMFTMSWLDFALFNSL